MYIYIYIYGSRTRACNVLGRLFVNGPRTVREHLLVNAVQVTPRQRLIPRLSTYDCILSLCIYVYMYVHDICTLYVTCSIPL